MLDPYYSRVIPGILWLLIPFHLISFKLLSTQFIIPCSGAVFLSTRQLTWGIRVFPFGLGLPFATGRCYNYLVVPLTLRCGDGSSFNGETRGSGGRPVGGPVGYVSFFLKGEPRPGYFGIVSMFISSNVISCFSRTSLFSFQYTWARMRPSELYMDGVSGYSSGDVYKAVSPSSTAIPALRFGSTHFPNSSGAIGVFIYSAVLNFYALIWNSQWLVVQVFRIFISSLTLLF